MKKMDKLPRCRIKYSNLDANWSSKRPGVVNFIMSTKPAAEIELINSKSREKLQLKSRPDGLMAIMTILITKITQKPIKHLNNMHQIIQYEISFWKSIHTNNSKLINDSFVRSCAHGCQFCRRFYRPVRSYQWTEGLNHLHAKKKIK